MCNGNILCVTHRTKILLCHSCLIFPGQAAIFPSASPTGTMTTQIWQGSHSKFDFHFWWAARLNRLMGLSVGGLITGVACFAHLSHGGVWHCCVADIGARLEPGTFGAVHKKLAAQLYPLTSQPLTLLEHTCPVQQNYITWTHSLTKQRLWEKRRVERHPSDSPDGCQSMH